MNNNRKSNLGGKLTVIRQSISNRQKPGSNRLSDAANLYLGVLTAVSVPVLAAAPSDMPTSHVNIKPSKQSAVKDDTLFICRTSMQSFAKKLEDRIQLLLDSKNLDQQVFCRAGKR